MPLAPFSSLTLRGRARRLKVLAQRALTQYDLDVRRTRLILNTWNCVFRIDTPEERYVIRVTLPGFGHSPQGVRSEAAFLRALRDETDIECPRPIPARDGRLVVSAGAPGVPEERMCVVYSWIPGRDLGASITPSNWRLNGALQARLHDFGARWTPPPDFAIGDYDRVFHFPGELVLWEHDLFGHTALLKEAQAASDELIARLRARDPVIITHGDLHHANSKLSRGVLRPIDFEDLMWATAGQDIGTSLYYITKRDDYAALRDAFQAGYETVRPWVERTPGEVDVLRFPRGLDLLNILVLERQFRVKDWQGTVERTARLARDVVERAEAMG